MTTSKPTVLFCVGATKAGTTWLHRYLQDHPQCATSFLKELHYFDFVENENFMRSVDRIIKRRVEMRFRLQEAEQEQRAYLYRQLAELDRWLSIIAERAENIPRYVAFLHSLNPTAKVVADITPAYSTLQASTIKSMVHLNGGDTRFIYIMRDPIDRMWSHIRMNTRRAKYKSKDMAVSADVILTQVENGQDPLMIARSDYAEALQKLESIVPERQRLVLFFEEFFNQDALNRICNFLEVDFEPAQSDDRIHEGIQLNWTSEQFYRMGRLLKPQYTAVEKQMGSLPARWHQHYDMLKVAL
ncbi:sulfotransferase [Parasulfitobacter algicola]|uniref:Sulfotransferase n=1 Tax=Parasulfitobacter algicola TaxID=2614809 RepID=A0ABX2INQ3_9RHOB|nr:sulfotransferase [Sulfitobacter algicola]